MASAVRPRESVVLDEDGVAEHTLRTSRWERTHRGLYVPAGTARTTTQRVVAAAALVPTRGAIGGWAAAHVHGADHLDGLDPTGAELDVDVLLPPDLHRLDVPGIAYRRASFGPGEVRVVHDLPSPRCCGPRSTWPAGPARSPRRPSTSTSASRPG